MSKYYNEYQPLSPRRGYITIMAIIAIVLIAAISLTVAFVIVPRLRELQDDKEEGKVIEPPKDNGEEPLEKLAAPYNLMLDVTQTKLSWNVLDSSNTVGYRLKINDTELDVYSNPVTVNLIEGRESVIYVKALGDNKNYSDSGWSAAFVVYKHEAEYIAYNIITSSMENILESKVKITVSGVQRAVIVNQIYTIDYNNHSARVWYSYSAGGSQGLAITTVAMPNISGILDYKNKQSQVDAIINNGEITTESMNFVGDCRIQALLSRGDLSGSLANYSHQNAILTPVCSYTSIATISEGKARIELRGIIRRERPSAINYYTYNYTAITDEVAGYTSQDYLDALSDNGVAFTFTERGAAEITGLGREMLIMYETHS